MAFADGKLLRISGFLQLCPYGMGAALGYGMALRADEKGAVVFFAGVLAADIGIETVDFVYQAIGLKKIQRTVHRGWCGRAGLADGCQQVIGFDRMVALPYQLQYAPAQPGQTCAVLRTDFFCLLEGGFYAVLVVVAVTVHGCVIV